MIPPLYNTKQLTVCVIYIVYKYKHTLLIREVWYFTVWGG